MTAALTAGDCVLDVSLACAWCFADEASDAAWAILAGLEQARAPVPSLWFWEITNVLVQAERRDRITTAVIRRFLALLETLPIVSDPAGPTCAWPVAIRSSTQQRPVRVCRCWPTEWGIQGDAVVRQVALAP